MDDEIQEKPTPSEDASIQERLESFLAAEEGDQPEIQPAEQAEAETEVETEGDVPEQADEPQLTTSDLAKVLGVDEDVLDSDEEGNLFIRTKIDGQEGRAKFEDFLKVYQLQGHIDNKAREVAEQQRMAQEAIAQQQQAISQRMQYVEDMANLAYQTLLQDSQTVDWAALARDDPAEYVARQHEFNARKGQIDQMMQAVQQHKMGLSQQNEQFIAQKLEKAKADIREAFPDWGSEKATETTKYITSYERYGISQQDLADLNRGVYGAAPLVWAHKAMLYDRMQQTKADVEKKVRTAPKLVKAGQPANESRQEKTVRDLKSVVKKSGGKMGITDYLIATGKA
jgi:hypothetical protein